jgi:hypothetical protein
VTAVAGLGRFVTPAAPGGTISPTSSGPSGQPAGGPPGAGRPGERCEMCAQRLPDEHTHLVDLTSRAMLCSCRACYFLFTPEGAAGGRYRPVPDRYLHDPDFQLTAAQWDELAIPVGVLFVFQHSAQGQPVAFYPSPAGATESLLPLDTWAQVMTANPAVADVLPDVEAVLLRRIGERFDGYLVPIDACYDLVGRVRLHWRGFAGGEEVWREIDGFFERLAQRSDQAVPSEQAMVTC